MKNLIKYYEKLVEMSSSSIGVYNFIYEIEEDYCLFPAEFMEMFDLDSNRVFDARRNISERLFEEDRSGASEILKNIMYRDQEIMDCNLRVKTANGKHIWFHCNGIIEKMPDSGHHVILGRVEEIGKKRLADNITNSFTEAKLYMDFQEYMEENENACGIFMIVGVDNLREINMNSGHDAGDRVLNILAECISEIIDSSSIYRIIGEDVFIILMRGCKDSGKAIELYSQLSKRIAEKCQEIGYQYIFTISAGIVLFTHDDTDYNKLHNYAEFALREAKDNGKNCAVIFDPERFENYRQKIILQERIRESVRNGFEGFQLYYQPIVSMKNFEVEGAEALLRFRLDGEFISPARVIPVLEESGLIVPVGQFIIETATLKCQEWKKYDPNFCIHINISYVQFRQSDLVGDVTHIFEKTKTDPANCVFEITESGFLIDSPKVLKSLSSFRKMGIKIALDDFGTGYSNFVYLKDADLDILKLDKVFVSGALKNETEYKLLSRIIGIANELNLETCLEGIESMNDLAAFISQDPDHVQGYVFGKPSDCETFEENFLKGERRIREDGELRRKELESLKPELKKWQM